MSDTEEGAVGGDRVGGSQIQAHVGSVGDDSQVAVGEHIQQVSTKGAPQLTPDERAELDQVLSGLKSQLQNLELDARTRVLAEERAAELQAELTKTDAAPDPSIIKVAGNWLLDHIPGLAGVITSVFTNPIVGKVVEAAGGVASDWVRDRLGHNPE